MKRFLPATMAGLAHIADHRRARSARSPVSASPARTGAAAASLANPTASPESGMLNTGRLQPSTPMPMDPSGVDVSAATRRRISAWRG